MWAGGYGSLLSQGRHLPDGNSVPHFRRLHHKLPVVPAKAGTHNHRERFRAHPSDQQVAEVPPLGIFALDQLDLPVTLPFLELLLTRDGLLGTLV